MSTYQTLQVQVEAVSWTGENVQEVTEFLQPAGLITLQINFTDPAHLKLNVNTREGGIMEPNVGDWIVLQGEKWIMKTSEEFAASYELVPEEPPIE